MAKHLADFRVNPGRYNPYKPGSRHYYRVRVFADVDTMWDVAARLSRKERDKNGGFEAITMPRWQEYLTAGEEWAVYPKVGDILFHVGFLGTEVICHESVHAATSFLRMLSRLELGEQIDDNEELLAFCVGSIARQIVSKLYSLEVFKRG